MLNSVIKLYPKEVKAFKCKLVALIQLGKYDDALTLLKKTPSHQMGWTQRVHLQK